MLVLRLFIFSLSASTFSCCVHASTQTHCYNSIDYTLDHKGSNLTCQQIEEEESTRIEVCKLDEVRSHCPKTCGLCCGNDSAFKFQTNNGSEKDCTWLGSKKVRSYLYCNEKSSEGQMVKDACTQACGACKPYVDNNDIPDYIRQLTLSPASSKNFAPTSSPSPTIENCIDSRKFKYKEKHTCLDLQRNENRRQKLCQRKMVRKACPVTCGLCCADDSTYSFIPNGQGRLQTCSSFPSSEVKLLRYCDEKNTRNACRFTCNNCFRKIAITHKGQSSTEEGQNDDENRDKGSISAINQDTLIRVSRDPMFLIIALAFIGIGLGFGAYGTFSHLSKQKLVKRKEEVIKAKVRDFNHYYAESIDSNGDQSKTSVEQKRSDLKAKVRDFNHYYAESIDSDGDQSKTSVEQKRGDLVQVGELMFGKSSSLSEKAQAPRKKKQAVNVKDFNHYHEEIIDVEDQPAPDNEEMIGDSLSIDKLTYERSSNLPRKASSTSFTAPSYTNLGKSRLPQYNVHKCMNFPCHNCLKNQEISFVKAPRTNVVRDNQGTIQFVPVPVDFIGDEETMEIKSLDTLTDDGNGDSYSL